jgi:hypothetical protein
MLFEKNVTGLYCPARIGGDCLVHPNGTSYRSNVAALVSACPGTWQLLLRTRNASYCDAYIGWPAFPFSAATRWS